MFGHLISYERPTFFFLFMQTPYLTKQGLANVQAELDELKNIKRPEATKRIEEAKALGDLSENAEYHDAKEALGMIEGRVFELEEVLKTYQLIDESGTDTKKVRIGSTVVVLVNGKEKTYTIVGSSEADPLAGKISNESPLGLALLNALVGGSVSVQTPAGPTVYKVLSIA